MPKPKNDAEFAPREVLEILYDAATLPQNLYPTSASNEPARIKPRDAEIFEYFRMRLEIIKPWAIHALSLWNLGLNAKTKPPYALWLMRHKRGCVTVYCAPDSDPEHFVENPDYRQSREQFMKADMPAGAIPPGPVVELVGLEKFNFGPMRGPNHLADTLSLGLQQLVERAREYSNVRILNWLSVTPFVHFNNEVGRARWWAETAQAELAKTSQANKAWPDGRKPRLLLRCGMDNLERAVAHLKKKVRAQPKFGEIDN